VAGVSEINSTRATRGLVRIVVLSFGSFTAGNGARVLFGSGAMVVGSRLPDVVGTTGLKDCGWTLTLPTGAACVLGTVRMLGVMSAGPGCTAGITVAEEVMVLTAGAIVVLAEQEEHPVLTAGTALMVGVTTLVAVTPHDEHGRLAAHEVQGLAHAG
jgi:hypothetical protein